MPKEGIHTSERTVTTNADEDVVKRVYFYIVGRSVNGFNPCEKQSGDFSECYKQAYYIIQQFLFWAFMQKKQKHLSEGPCVYVCSW